MHIGALAMPAGVQLGTHVDYITSAPRTARGTHLEKGISMYRLLLSSIMCSALAAGCAATSDTDEDQAPQTGETEQALAQERTVIYYNEPAKIHRVGICEGPFHCFARPGLVCSGRQTPYKEIIFTSCNPP